MSKWEISVSSIQFFFEPTADLKNKAVEKIILIILK